MNGPAAGGQGMYASSMTACAFVVGVGLQRAGIVDKVMHATDDAKDRMVSATQPWWENRAVVGEQVTRLADKFRRQVGGVSVGDTSGPVEPGCGNAAEAGGPGKLCVADRCVRLPSREDMGPVQLAGLVAGTAGVMIGLIVYKHGWEYVKSTAVLRTAAVQSRLAELTTNGLANLKILSSTGLSKAVNCVRKARRGAAMGLCCVRDSICRSSSWAKSHGTIACRRVKTQAKVYGQHGKDMVADMGPKDVVLSLVPASLGRVRAAERANADLSARLLSEKQARLQLESEVQQLKVHVNFPDPDEARCVKAVNSEVGESEAVDNEKAMHDPATVVAITTAVDDDDASQSHSSAGSGSDDGFHIVSPHA